MTAEQKYYTSTFIVVNLTAIFYNEKARSVTLYAYCGNDPINLVDPTGMETEDDNTDNPKPSRWNINVQRANAERDHMQSTTGNKNGSKYSVEARPGNKDVHYADVMCTYPSGEKERWTSYESDEKQGAWGYFLNFGHILDAKMTGSSDGANDGHEAREQFLDDYVQPTVSGAALFNPILGLYNSAKTLVTGSDIYENKADGVDKALSIVDIVTFGLGSKLGNLFKVSKSTERTANAIGTATTVGTASKTAITETKKKNK